MADQFRKMMRKIRRVPRDREPRKETKAEYDKIMKAAEEHKKAFWERDKKRNRETAFQKAILVMQKNREKKRLEAEAEQARQDMIYNNRIKALRKARKAKENK